MLSTTAVVIKTALKVFLVLPKKIKILVSSKRERERERESETCRRYFLKIVEKNFVLVVVDMWKVRSCSKMCFSFN